MTQVSSEAGPLLDIRGISKVYRTSSLFGSAIETNALDNVSLSISKGGCVGVVGESGSGKSTLARCILGLEQPSAGEIRFEGHRIDAARGGARDRGQIQPIFQNPASSLNPRRRIGAIIAEPLAVHAHMPRDQREAEVARLLDLVSLPRDYAQRYPSELSGGQCQRISIARALALRPKLIIADEATSALDVLIQRQIVKLLATLRSEFGIAILFVSHNLAVTAALCDDMIVMHRGKIVEAGATRQVIKAPQHAYTRVLLHSVPAFGRRRKDGNATV